MAEIAELTDDQLLDIFARDLRFGPPDADSIPDYPADPRACAESLSVFFRVCNVDGKTADEWAAKAAADPEGYYVECMKPFKVSEAEARREYRSWQADLSRRGSGAAAGAAATR